MRRLCVVFLGASLLVVAAPGCAKTDTGDDDPTVDARRQADAGNGQCDFCSSSDGCCNGFCVDIQSSQLHCGECNHACTTPSSDGCSMGNCTCNFGTACTGANVCCAGVGCKDILTDKLHCGVCGRACPDPDNESCVEGSCVCAATGGLCEGATPDCCSSGCVDTNTDSANCGECGHACGGESTCEAGECVYTCTDDCSNPDLGFFLPGCCSAGCVDLGLDGANCGSCDTICPSGLCLLGTCL